MGVDWTALEEAIRKSALRQAREVIDLSLLSQRQIIEDLRQLGDARSTAA